MNDELWKGLEGPAAERAKGGKGDRERAALVRRLPAETPMSWKWIAAEWHLCPGCYTGRERGYDNIKNPFMVIMGCGGILERGYGRNLVPDLRKAYLSLLAQNIRIDREILNQSLATQRLPAI